MKTMLSNIVYLHSNCKEMVYVECVKISRKTGYCFVRRSVPAPEAALATAQAASHASHKIVVIFRHATLDAKVQGRTVT